MTKSHDYALAIHGGAGAKPGRDYAEVEAHLADLIARGEDMLKRGAAAVDVVQDMVRELEVSGLYVAGRGAAPNAAGYVELDASIMDGASGKAGAVTCVRDLESPVAGARAVMDESAHVLLAGPGADRFCESRGVARVTAPENWYRVPVGVDKAEMRTDELAHGTVGAVALDREGRLASATSTGGLFGKREGRVGDTPIVGLGTWADDAVAVSCTGLGEYFMLAAAAYDVSARVRYGQQALPDAVQGALDRVKAPGGDGGIIAVSATGEVVMDFNSHGMKRASVIAGGKAEVKVFQR